jgi:hypothetical protein
MIPIRYCTVSASGSKDAFYARTINVAELTVEDVVAALIN